MITFPSDLASHYTGKPDGGFVLLANVGTIDASAEVLPGLTLRRAELYEATILREFLMHEPSAASPMPRRNPYETKLIVEHVGENAKKFQWQPLDEREFKYVVAAFVGTNTQAYHLVERSPLAGFDLAQGPTVMSVAGGFGYSWAPDVEQTMESLQHDETSFLRLDQQAVVELRDVFTRYGALDDSRVGLVV